MGVLLKTDSVIFNSKNFGTAIVSEDRYIEYIQGDGNSYINTGFTGYRAVWQDTAGTIPDDLPRIEVDFAVPSTERTAIFGTIDNSSFNLYVENGTNATLNGKGAISNFTIATDEKVTLKYGSLTSCVNSTQLADNSDMSNQYRINNYDTPIILGGAYMQFTSESGLYLNDAKIYGFRAYLGDTMTLDLRPYMRKNGTICMRDELTGSFYYNQGSGSFKAGL